MLGAVGAQLEVADVSSGGCQLLREFFRCFGAFSLSNEGAVINNLVSGFQALKRCEAERGREHPQAPLPPDPFL